MMKKKKKKGPKGRSKGKNNTGDKEINLSIEDDICSEEQDESDELSGTQSEDLSSDSSETTENDKKGS